MKTGHILFFVASMLVCSGCGTVIGRTGVRDLAYGEKIPRCYPATYVDGAMIGESLASKDSNTSGGARFFLCVGSTIDLPISVVVDTLLLPYDAFKPSDQKPAPNAERTGVSADSSASRSTSQPSGSSALGR